MAVRGAAVVLLHGFGDTATWWAPLAAKLMKDHTSSFRPARYGPLGHPETGYTKKNQGVDIAGVMDYLKIRKSRPSYP